MEERTVKLSLAEYEELILNNHDLLKEEVKVNRIFNLIEDYAKMGEGSAFGFKGIEISNVFEFTKELLQMLYYVDSCKYNRIAETLYQHEGE